MRTFTLTRALVAGAALFTTAEACAQAHNVRIFEINAQPVMRMEVYLNDNVVCRGNTTESFESDDPTFCLSNRDGEDEGCAPGYVYCTNDYGRVGFLEYYGIFFPLFPLLFPFPPSVQCVMPTHNVSYG